VRQFHFDQVVFGGLSWQVFSSIPRLHPDGYEATGSGWPKHFKPFAAKAWRRFEIGELTDNELYCYQACKARIGLVREEVKQKTPWVLSDHFAV
jgi:hypothetical protein